MRCINDSSCIASPRLGMPEMYLRADERRVRTECRDAVLQCTEGGTTTQQRQSQSSLSIKLILSRKHATDFGVEQLGEARTPERVFLCLRYFAKGRLGKHEERDRQRQAIALEGYHFGSTAQGERCVLPTVLRFFLDRGAAHEVYGWSLHDESRKSDPPAVL